MSITLKVPKDLERIRLEDVSRVRRAQQQSIEGGGVWQSWARIARTIEAIRLYQTTLGGIDVDA